MKKYNGKSVALEILQEFVKCLSCLTSHNSRIVWAVVTKFSLVTNGTTKHFFAYPKIFSKGFNLQWKHNAKLDTYFMSISLAKQVFIFLFNCIKWTSSCKFLSQKLKFFSLFFWPWKTKNITPLAKNTPAIFYICSMRNGHQRHININLLIKKKQTNIVWCCTRVNWCNKKITKTRFSKMLIFKDLLWIMPPPLLINVI